MVSRDEAKDMEANQYKVDLAAKAYSDNYIGMAEDFYNIQPFFYSENKIWWLWNFKLSSWDRIDEVDLINLLSKYLPANIDITKSNNWSRVIKSMMMVGREKKPKEIPKTWVQFKKKIYDLDKDMIFESSPDYFSTNPIPWDIGDKEDTPNMDRIFGDWCEDKKSLLYEIIAYCMIPDYPLSKIFCLIGSGSNGKSKYLEVISNFIGERNICSTELGDLIKNRFEMSSLYRKLVCLIGETDFVEVNQTQRLKSLSGGDLVKVEFKGKEALFVRNYAKLLIATNSLPATRDKTDGFYRRWIILDFKNQFTEEKDILSEIPEEEYSNLARKSINIIKNILKERQFSYQGSLKDRMEAYERHSNPLNHFIKEKCIVDVNEEYVFWKFYDAYCIYLKERGKRIVSKKELSKLLDNEGYSTEKENIKVGNEYKKWVMVKGLKIKEKVTDFSTDSTDSTVGLFGSHGVVPDIGMGTMSTMSTKTEKKLRTISMIQDYMNIFHDSDENPYGPFKKGDVVNLAAELADILLDLGVAEPFLSSCDNEALNASEEKVE